MHTHKFMDCDCFKYYRDEMKMIKQGAEAKLYLDKYDEENIIIKDRIENYGYLLEKHT